MHKAGQMTEGSLHLAPWNATIRWHRPKPNTGTGRPLICLPALSMPAKESFEATVTDPSLVDFDPILIDYLGSGKSDHPADFPWTVEAHADNAAAVMDHLGCGPCPVLGHSMGGSVAIALALRRPDLVSRLIIGEGNLTPGGGAATRRIAAFSREDFVRDGLASILASLRAAGTEGDIFVNFVAKAWSYASAEGLHGNSVALVTLRTDFAAEFLDLDIPRTFIYGAETYPGNTGVITPDQPDPDLLRRHNVDIAIVAGVGHALQLAQPQAFARALAAALT
jgi:pimeloyl-ACP methyl ester carboxylesterase